MSCEAADSAWGPRCLGRGVIVAAGAPDNPDYPLPEAAERVCVDDATLSAPAEVIDFLARRWSQREPVVVELGANRRALALPEICDDPAYELDPEFEFARERLYFLVRANNYDARQYPPRWGPSLEAERLGATPGGPADVLLADGTPVWCDGGPRGPIEADDADCPEHAILHRVEIRSGHLEPDRSPEREADADLADDQRAAVRHGSGAARIIAPAGSGKTRVLTARLRHLVGDRGWSDESVTALAYNRKAADEMRARLAGTPGAAPRCVRTLHAFGYGLLCDAAGMRLDVVDEYEVRRRVERLVDLRWRANTDVIAPYLDALAEVRLGLRDPKDVEADSDEIDGFGEMFGEYRAGLAADRVLDFDEQIYGALELLLRDPATRGGAQARCRHLLVDEFQDLTAAQMLLVRLLAAPTYDVFGVGDDDQTIYGYQGADPGYLIDFASYFPGANEHALETNYRCPEPIVTAADHLLSHNRRRVKKVIRAARAADESGAALTTLTAESSELAGLALGQIESWIAAGTQPAEIAVLARVNALLLAPHVLLADAGVAFASDLGPAVLERTGTRTALAYLRLARAVVGGAGLDSKEIRDTIRRPSRRLKREIVDRVAGGGARKLDAIEAMIASLSDNDADKLGDYVSDLRLLASRLDAGATSADLLVAVRDRVGLGSNLSVLDSSKTAPSASHADDLDALIAAAAAHPDAETFEHWVRDRLRPPGAGAAQQGVVLASVHRVKGLEFERVIVFGANDGIFPHRLADDEEEERRVFHVGITRAGAEAVVIADEDDPSDFIYELDRYAPEPTPEEIASAQRPEAGARAGRRGRLPARVGLELVADGGFAGTIAQVRDSGAMVALEAGGRLLVRFGEQVSVDGKAAELGPPRSGVAAGDDADPAVVEALKAWRKAVAAERDVPAFVILHDRHLRGIADARPGTLGELADCDGIGSHRLDEYGDDILAVLEAVDTPG